MKKIVSIALVLVMILSFAGCGLFSDNTLVKFDDTHSHKDPEGLTYDERIVLKNDAFANYIEETANSAAYPDTMYYDKNGNIIGMYTYDAETGLASGWTRISDGKYTEFKKGNEVNLGKPDESLMIDIPGDVIMGTVVYGAEKKAVAAYSYLFYTDANAKDMLIENMTNFFGAQYVEDGENTLKFVQDADAISKEFDAAKESGYEIADGSAAEYAELLKGYYFLREYTGENPYEPFADYNDPEDIEFDEKVVLVGSGEYAVLEEDAQNISSMTDVLYAKEGKMVAHYTYYQCPSKEAADSLMKNADKVSLNPVRLTDTVIQASITGKELEDHISQYVGYSVLNDDTISDYTRMIEETYFSVVCD